jgi:hypothetical protein
MATFNISWTPCGSSSDAQYIYYGKSNIVTGTPISGTGWTLYTGAALSNSIGSATINGLDDNVEYTVYGYCHCPAAGNGPLSNFGPVIKYACPVLSNIAPTYNGVSYALAIPNSANNSGTWIEKTLVNLYDSSLQNLLQTNTYGNPFGPTITGSFTALNSSSNYNLQVVYSNNTGTKTNQCGSSPFTTSAPCTAPTVTVNNPTANTFDVNWTPTTGGTFDVLVNNNVVASGLTTGPYTVTSLAPATIYQVNVRKNCTTGGNAISATQNITTSNANVNGVISMNSNVNVVNNSQQGNLSLSFSFPQPTQFPMTLYFGYTHENACNSCTGGKCNWSNGYDIFTPPNGAQNCPGSPSGDGYSGPPHLPFVVNIPQGVTTYNSGTSIYTTLGNPGPSGGVIGPWQNLGGGPGARGYTDLYVKVNSPNGYSANFTITNGTNISGVNIHNV